MAPFHCEQLTKDNEQDWEAFNRDCPDGTIYHSLRWKQVIERSFGHKGRYFIIYDKEKPVAICPFFEVPLHGRRSLTPPPATDIRHILVDRAQDMAIYEEVAKELTAMAKAEGYSFAIVTDPDPRAIERVDATLSQSRLKTYPLHTNGYFMLDLKQNPPDYIWNTLLSGKSRRNHRKYVRRFEQSGYTIRDSRDKKDLDLFYTYYEENLNYIGASPFAKSHFEILFDLFSKDELRMTFLEKDDHLAGGAMGLIDTQRGAIHLRYLALNRDIGKTYHPPYALSWEEIQFAYANNIHLVCFGTNNKDPMDRNYAMKRGFGPEYHDYYSTVAPMNYGARLIYSGYQKLKEIKDRDKPVHQASEAGPADEGTKGNGE
ncbi:MAG: GNAT family N-acetyltransferase [Methanomassiliicoccus sp.]|nr:GNAT family N-acetyltransferase [Methanomassiliicoccus sp.]